MASTTQQPLSEPSLSQDTTARKDEPNVPPSTTTGNTTTTSTPQRPTITGLNHIKLPCHSIRRTVTFYTTILPFTPLPQYDHFTPTNQLFASMFHLAQPVSPPASSPSPQPTSPPASSSLSSPPSSLLIEARYHPTQANAQKGWDPITLGVRTRQDLEDWGRWLDSQNVKRSPVFVGVKGWVMGLEDPDGRVVRLYVEEEEHEWTNEPDRDEFWLGFVQGDPAAAAVVT